MELSLLIRLLAWFAYLSAAATLATFLTGILFFTVGKPFGKINDVVSIFQMLLMVPTAILFGYLIPLGSAALGWFFTLLGIGGMLAAIYGQTLLVFGRIDFETSTRYFPSGAAIGGWLIGICVLAIAGGQLPITLNLIGIGAGTGYISTVIGFLRGGQQHPLFYSGGLLLGIGYPVWGFWLGKLLLSGAIIFNPI